MATGMLDALFATKQKDLLAEERAEDQRLQFQAQDPFKAAALATYEGGTMVGRGLGRTAAAAMGRDPRTATERQSGDLEKAKAEIAAMEDVDFSTPAGVDKYYLGVINILRKNGLPGEAHAAAIEWNKHKNDTADRNLKVDELQRKKDADAAKAAAEAKKAEIASERNNILRSKGMPEVIQLIDQIDKQPDGPTRARMIQAFNAHLESKKKGVVLEDAGDRVIVRDKATGAIIGTDLKGAEPESEKDAAKRKAKDGNQEQAYISAMASAQEVYDAVVRLYNHPGLAGITGRKGILIGERAGDGTMSAAAKTILMASGDAARQAYSIYNQVLGNTFLAGLARLKAASPTGSTGLGQVSNIEGEQVRNAAAALHLGQATAGFRASLKIYLQQLVASANRLAAAAPGDNLEPIRLKEKPLGVPGRGAPAAEAAPAAAPQQPAQSTEKATVRLYHPKTRKAWNILPDKVEEAKRRGFTETQ